MDIVEARTVNKFYIAQLFLRILLMAFTLAGAVITATSHQTVTVFGIVMDARYNYSSSFRFKVIVDSLVWGLSVLSVIGVIILNHPKSNPSHYFYLLLHDLVSEILLLSGCSASIGVGYIAKYGQDETGWVAICNRVAKFCDKIVVSIVMSVLAVICLLALIMMSAHKLKSHVESQFPKAFISRKRKAKNFKRDLTCGIWSDLEQVKSPSVLCPSPVILGPTILL